jgi:hypothetical protein
VRCAAAGISGAIRIDWAAKSERRAPFSPREPPDCILSNSLDAPGPEIFCYRFLLSSFLWGDDEGRRSANLQGKQKPLLAALKGWMLREQCKRPLRKINSQRFCQSYCTECMREAVDTEISSSTKKFPVLYH